MEKDPQGRATNADLDPSDIEKLFREHIKMLNEVITCLRAKSFCFICNVLLQPDFVLMSIRIVYMKFYVKNLQNLGFFDKRGGDWPDWVSLRHKSHESKQVDYFDQHV